MVATFMKLRPVGVRDLQGLCNACRSTQSFSTRLLSLDGHPNCLAGRGGLSSRGKNGVEALDIQQTFSGDEEKIFVSSWCFSAQSQDFLVDNLRAWLCRIEEKIVPLLRIDVLAVFSLNRLRGEFPVSCLPVSVAQLVPLGCLYPLRTAGCSSFAHVGVPSACRYTPFPPGGVRVWGSCGSPRGGSPRSTVNRRKSPRAK